MTIYQIKKTLELSKENSKLQIQGIGGTCPSAQVTNIDWRVPDERWVTGGILVSASANWGDTVSLQVIDIDNVVGFGAGTVLATFAKDVFLYPGSGLQLSTDVSYVALVVTGVYIRLVYTNTGVTAAGIALNLKTHIPLA